MDAIEFLDLLKKGETSQVQFKEALPNSESLSREIVAMSNTAGGLILFGIKDKTAAVIGLSAEQIEYADRKIAEYADAIEPPIYLFTEVVEFEANKLVLVVHIKEGINKPYKTAKGEIYVKQGSNKRLLTDNTEILRLFQSSGQLFFDETTVFDSSVNDINEDKVRAYLKQIPGKSEEELPLITTTLLKNLLVLKEGKLTIGGLLFFGKAPQKYRPAFCVKAISFFGNELSGTEYRSSKDIIGTIPEMFEQSLSFLNANLHSLQSGQNFNSVGKLEIAPIALEELVQNALIHRDYLKNAPVRIAIFDNRLEIISPGKLPNSLTVDAIKIGNAAVRNNLMVSYSAKTMKYRGFGSGISRAIQHQPNIELINDTEGEQFIVKIPRPAFKE